MSYGVAAENVTEADGEWAAARWRRGEGLSLADRLCLSLAHRLHAPALTADATCGHDDPVRQIR
jgi:ribonuclease VapC